MGKVKRPDVSKRLQDNKLQDHSVIKTTWNSWAKKETKNVLQIDKLLLNINQISFEGYKLANLHVVRLLDSNITPIIDKNFYYNCLSGVSSSKRKEIEIKDVELRKSIKLYNSYKPDAYRSGDKSYMNYYFQNISKQMITEFDNSFQANFYSRLKRYFKLKYGCDGKQCYELIKNIYDTNYIGDDVKVMKYKSMLNWEYPNSNNTLPLQYEILKHFERCKVKLFSILPNRRSFGINYVKIDTNSLYKSLRLHNLVNVSEKEFIADKEIYWKKLFNIEKFVTKNRKFAHEFLTDGRAVSIVLKKPKLQAKLHKVSLKDYDRIWGLDPGRKDVFVASDNSNNLIKCSSKEYYHDAKFNWCRGKIQRWYNRDKEISKILHGMPSLKVTTVIKIGEYINYALRHLNRLLEFHFTKNFRGIKFKRFIASKKKIASICQKIAKTGKNVLVGFGDWSNNDKIVKRHPKGPVLKIKQELSRTRGVKVVDVDEFRTSKLCNHCKCELIHNHSKSYDVFGNCFLSQKIHCSLRCTNVSCHRDSVNRDVNASRNILEILISKTRPNCFARQHKPEATVDATSFKGAVYSAIRV